MDDPSLQLQNTIHESIQDALASQRPVLTHLNADTTWLLQLPYPSHASRPLRRSRFNLLFDPWLQGPQSDVASWFSSRKSPIHRVPLARAKCQLRLGGCRVRIIVHENVLTNLPARTQGYADRRCVLEWHTTESSVQTIGDLETHLYEIERLAHFNDRGHGYVSPLPKSRHTYIDAVIISHEFTDHCNKHTLLELDPDTPIFATRLAANLITSWGHFGLVHEIPPFCGARCDWRMTCLSPLPDWIGISRIVTQRDALYYHSAILVTFDLQNPSREEQGRAVAPAEAVIYSPHGIHASDLRYLPSAKPPIEILVLLHGLHDIRISVKQLNLGAHNGLQAQRICNAKYWISTHDEIKKASGFITPFLHRKVLTLQEALEEEKSEKGKIPDESKLADMREVTFAELANGESLLLV